MRVCSFWVRSPFYVAAAVNTIGVLLIAVRLHRITPKKGRRANVNIVGSATVEMMEAAGDAERFI